MVKKVRELSARDKVGLAAYAVLGKDYLSEAFRCTHDIRNAKPGSIYTMQSRWINGQQEKEFIESIRNQYADLILQNISEDIKLSNEQLNTIIQRGIVSEKDPKKQADMSLKLMQWRKDANVEEGKEQRTYFIPWVSHCRTCKLMKLYQDIQRKKEDENEK